MERSHNNTGDQLRQTKGTGQEGYIFETVHNQHAHDGAGKNRTQVFNNCGGLSLFTKDQKWQEASGHGDKHSYGDQKNIMHLRSPPSACRSSGQWSAK